ncbi:MAG: ftsW [Rickettsiaceae bacterium]|jgi:cell division protein FtsW|nr:ftsW [Rickettsiaceae bacterium]
MENWQSDNQIVFDRRNLNPFKKWWIDIDRISLLLVIGLIAFGLMMAFISSPAVAKKISVDKLFFVKKQAFFVVISIFTILAISFLDKQQIKLISVLGIATCLVLLVLVLIFGSEAKGAKRWIMVLGFNLQPSEFAKIFFLVFNAFLLQKLQYHKWFIKYGTSAFLYLCVVALLILQPDFGMTIIFSLLWAIQLFIFGLPMFLVIMFSCFALVGGMVAYNSMPHVADRINKFLNLNQKNYQVERAVDAYVNGGFFGVGPGNGLVKKYIPDAHTDFIFAVVAEEFGVISCVFVMVVFLIIIGRIIKRIKIEDDLFCKLAVIGLISQIALQTFINVGVSVGMLPTKGMTLPFISYGGSSIIAVSIGFGIVLSLTKKRYHDKIDYDNIVINDLSQTFNTENKNPAI